MPGQLLGLSRAAARATVTLTRDMWLHSTCNQLVLLVPGFMSAAPPAALQGKKLPCGKLPLYSTDVMGRKSKGLCRAENCAVQARQREDESIDIADKYKAVQNIIQNKAAK